MTTFTLPNNYTVQCRSEKTRYGFRHLAFLQRGGCEVAKDKACYYNRTWESYMFQTVVHGVIKKYFSEPEVTEYCQIADKQGHGFVEDTLHSVGLIAKLGDLFCTSQEDRNRWKRRMLSTGLSGLDFPDDFDDLPEAEKEKRLNKVIDLTLNKGENDD